MPDIVKAWLPGHRKRLGRGILGPHGDRASRVNNLISQCPGVQRRDQLTCKLLHRLRLLHGIERGWQQALRNLLDCVVQPLIDLEYGQHAGGDAAQQPQTCHGGGEQPNELRHQATAAHYLTLSADSPDRGSCV